MQKIISRGVLLISSLIALATHPAAASGATSGTTEMRREAGILHLAQSTTRPRRDDAYRPPEGSGGSLGTLGGDPRLEEYPPAPGAGYGGYRPQAPGYTSADPYRVAPGAPLDGRRDYGPPAADDRYRGGPGEPYAPPPGEGGRRYEDPRSDDRRYEGPPQRGRYADESRRDGTYSQNEIMNAGHSFFGAVSQGLANVVEYAFKRQGRPNGYILGEDAGGAFVAGLRYGEGTLYTKDAGTHRVYWQGPSIGYDFGGEGSKTMVLVYDLRDPSEIYDRFGGIEGSAYLVGGVGIQFQKTGEVVLAPIRSGIGLRLGANIGYTKYTRRPTWNPF
jgi:hypothetical protein